MTAAERAALRRKCKARHSRSAINSARGRRRGWASRLRRPCGGLVVPLGSIDGQALPASSASAGEPLSVARGSCRARPASRRAAGDVSRLGRRPGWNTSVPPPWRVVWIAYVSPLSLGWYSTNSSCSVSWNGPVLRVGPVMELLGLVTSRSRERTSQSIVSRQRTLRRFSSASSPHPSVGNDDEMPLGLRTIRPGFGPPYGVASTGHHNSTCCGACESPAKAPGLGRRSSSVPSVSTEHASAVGNSILPSAASMKHDFGEPRRRLGGSPLPGADRRQPPLRLDRVRQMTLSAGGIVSEQHRSASVALGRQVRSRRRRAGRDGRHSSVPGSRDRAAPALVQVVPLAVLSWGGVGNGTERLAAVRQGPVPQSPIVWPGGGGRPTPVWVLGVSVIHGASPGGARQGPDDHHPPALNVGPCRLRPTRRRGRRAC